MKSELPKVLHTLGGRPLLAHVIKCAHLLGADTPRVVIGHGAAMLQQRLADMVIQWVEQAEQLGTGHAVEQAMPGIDDADMVLVLYGDVPLVRHNTLKTLVETANSGCLALLTVELEEPGGYGRIVREDGEVVAIVEQKDASEQQLAINEINTGILAVHAGRLRSWLAKLDNDNIQGEYYLTDIVALAVADGVKVSTVTPASKLGEMEVMGVNDRVQLSQCERYYQRMNAEELMQQGVTLRDPARFDLRGELTAGRDVVIDVNVIIEGDVTLGDRVSIGPNVILTNCTIGDDSVVLANCVIEDATVGKAARIGPFTRLRPEASISDNAHIGNFVEIKKSIVGQYSKVNHLSYIGDSVIGNKVNIGAGTITCNYDGANKFKTIIGDNAFIGSNTQLIAPVKVGEGATIGAGSTITEDAPDGELTISRAKQKTIKGWKRPVKKK